ncbi:MAG: FtsQ-type POTRA domain-containing protein, partial [Phyllobacteriaceae bacterium]|nr:FtsQ-type POTRA domain-containing protein [Phyllobacteriaceae bacterium]
MDGQRRIARPLNRRGHKGRIEAALTSLNARIAARGFAVLFLGASIIAGGVDGGAFQYQGSPFNNFNGRIAGLFGMAAQDIRIAGLAHHEPEAVLSHIGVRPGGSLVGFDAEEARVLLESLDWIAEAEVRRAFPNSLEISLNEREPFAIWQMDGNYAVIDREGVEMSGLNPLSLRHLPLVTGKGANIAAADYVNQMEAIPDVKLKVQAAARVGERRWTLYLDNGVKIALPETGAEAALKKVAELDATQKILSKGIREIDLRTPDRIVIA